MKYYAHFSKSEPQRWQSLKDHLLESYKLSILYGEPLNLGHVAGLAGLLHDIGKYNTNFQKYLKQAAIDPDSVRRGSVDHSSAGGRLIFDLMHDQDNNSKLLSEIIGNAIISHHSGGGLNDFIDPEDTSSPEKDVPTWTPYIRRVESKEIDNYQQIKEAFKKDFLGVIDLKDEIDLAKIEFKNFMGELSDNNLTSIDKERYLFLLMKFIYSCLIDADRTGTMCFENSEPLPEVKSNGPLFSKYYQRLVESLENMGSENKSKINNLRQKMSLACDNFASRKTGTYKLSVPTGGGKTLASLRFALKHAVINKKNRIIYIVPYTTIIEQNAAIIREKLNGSSGDDHNILEFHSNVTNEKIIGGDKQIDSDDDHEWQLIQDTWDSPIVLTTMVQFLDVFYGGGTRSVRRLHNLSNSVIIFDEVQNVPPKCMDMFNEALNFLKNQLQTTNVLCTATQPALDQVTNGLDVSENAEMVPDLASAVTAFQRVNLVDRLRENWTLQGLSDFAIQKEKEVGNVLLVVNTKKAARELYKLLLTQGREDDIYHLSTNMCPAHRQKQLSIIEERLGKGQNTICVSTQLIEAGVDISFNCVIRSRAGLDSVAQAAGRCNRHGEADRRNVYLVNINQDEENVENLQEIEQGGAILEGLLAQVKEPNVLFQNEWIGEYFKKFYDKFKDKLNYPYEYKHFNLFGLMDGEHTKEVINSSGKCIGSQLMSSSQTIAKYFNVIDNMTTTVIVPYKSGDDNGALDLINKLNGEIRVGEVKSVLKAAQKYTLNLYNTDLKELQTNGLIYPLQNGDIFALQDSAYSSERSGLNTEGTASINPSSYSF